MTRRFLPLLLLVVVALLGCQSEQIDEPRQVELTSEDKLDIQQIMAGTVTLVTAMQNDHDGDLSDTRHAFSTFIDDHYHEAFEYRILGVSPTPLTFDRDAYLTFFVSESENVSAVDRLLGLPMYTSYQFDEATQQETAVVQNSAWANLVFADDPETLTGNFADLEWTFTRQPGEAWQLFIWDDSPKLFPLASAPQR